MHFYGIHASGDFNYRCPVKGVGKSFCVNRGRGDDNLQLGAPLAEQAQVADEEIYVEAALVSLVDDDGVVFAQIAIALRLGQEHPVSHHFYEGLW